MKKIAILGVTGSIGMQSLDVIRKYPEDFELVAISGGYNLDSLRMILQEFPTIKMVSLADSTDVNTLQFEFPNHSVVHGEQGMVDVSTFPEADITLVAVVGFRGLAPTVEAIKTKKIIALANKETLVCAGKQINELLEKYDGQLIPVDSEHSAIFQALNGEEKKEINRLIITASGGSLRNLSRKELADITVERALEHPNWTMGANITIDSATMFNKGLEIIEAHHLFGVPYDKIDVLIHPESLVHSIVEFADYSQIAQLSTPDMQLPIQYALTYPERKKSNINQLKLDEIQTLTFKKADFKRYPALEMAYDAGRRGNTYPTVLNAAKESAVELFLQGKIKFLDIEKIVKEELDNHEEIENPVINDLIETDRKVKEKVKVKWGH